MLKKYNYISISFWAFVAFLLINTLFILKYGSRQYFLPTYFITIIYVLGIVFTISFIEKKQKIINTFKQFNTFYVGVSFLVFLGIVFIDFYINGNSLNVDRWSALDTVIKNVLQGEYPYNKLDHLQNTSSNLPGLFYIVLPFYIVGSVGLLQPFVFLFLVFFLLKSTYKNYQKLLVLTLFLASPAFWWEIFAKSDLMSNIIIVFLFILIWSRKYASNYFKNIPVLAFFVVLFVLTRGVVVIPLTLFLFKPFVQLSLKRKGLFLTCFLGWTLLISLPFLITITDLEVVKRHNPFNHQTAFMPKILQFLMVITPFFLSYKVKNNRDIICYTFLIFFCFLGITTVLNIFEEGYYEAIIIGLTDISYLSMTLPFAIYTFVFSKKILCTHNKFKKKL